LFKNLLFFSFWQVGPSHMQQFCTEQQAELILSGRAVEYSGAHKVLN